VATQKDASAVNGRYLAAGEPVWTVGLECNGRDWAMTNRRVFLSLWLVTQNSYEFVRNGNNVVTPFKFTLKIGIAEMAGLSASEVESYLFALLSPKVTNSVSTVLLGQSRAEVEQIMGSPERIVDLGPKVIYVHKSFKITFRDGKVEDVE